MKKGRLFFLIVLAIVATASFSYGETITFNLAEVFSDGDTPIRNDVNKPFLTATFVDIASSQVQLTLSATNLTGVNQFISEFFFNVNSNVFTGPPLSFLSVLGPQVIDIGQSPDGVKAGPDGSFNIEFDFATSNGNNSDRFDAGESVVYDILSTGVVISASSFNLVNTSGYLSIAHVQGIPLGTGTEGSSWIVAPPASAPVPEPATMLLLGAGLIGVAFFGRKKF